MARQNNSAVSDEALVAALMTHATITDAAAAVGISPRAVYDRMAKRSFQAAYNAARSDLIRGTVQALNKCLTAAVEAVFAILTDKEAAPAIRLQAAKLIFDNAGKFAARLAESDFTAAKFSAPEIGFDPDSI